MPNTRISAVVNCFNEELWIGPSIRSLIDKVDEIVILDNCSTDNTEQEIKKILDEKDQFTTQIEYRRSEISLELAVARNQAMEMATGDWILKWDGDFVAYDVQCNHPIATPIESLLRDVRVGKYDDYDVVFLHSINVSGDVFHIEERRPYLGLHGDSFIIKKGRINYVADENFVDTGIIRNEQGGPAKYFKINTPGDPMYFLHIYGVKEDYYYLYTIDLL